MATRKIVPRADNEGGVGTAVKKWASFWSYLYNGLVLTAQAIGFTISGGTTSKTLTITGDATISGGTHSGTNTGDVVKAAGSDITTGTEDTKFVTAKALTDALISPKLLQGGGLIYAADAGANDSYAVTLSPVPSAYTTGMVVNFKANTINTGACTLNVNSLGAKTIKKSYNLNLADGDIKANQFVSVIYDGTNFQLIGGVGGSSVAHVVVRKTSDETDSTATQQNDNELLFAIGANEVWTGQCVLFTSAVCNARGSLGVPSGATYVLGGDAADYIVDVGAVPYKEYSTTTVVRFGSTSADTVYQVSIITFTVVNGANAGTVNFKWAAQTGSATLYTNSTLIAHKI